MKVLVEILDSRKKPSATNGMFLQRPKYITNYFRENQPYSAGCARIVRVVENQFVVFCERWNHIITKNGEGKK
ncbi:MAG TPA: hypothetical protein PKE69_17810 [Pyrinomonadaceae bacterium]|nr:hypothetical protein [Pyrinomonadaceae bacterium]